PRHHRAADRGDRRVGCLPADRPVEARRRQAASELGTGRAAMTHLTPPHIDYQGMAPLFAVTGGSIVVLMASLFRSRWVHRVLVPALTVIALGAAIGLSIWNWEPGDTKPILEGALAVDTLSLGISILC